MFTGIVEEVGVVAAIGRSPGACVLSIRAERVFEDLKIGDSVAVDGVCLTAASISEHMFTADVMAETMRRSSLGALKQGGRVNLERAMPADGRFGGHLVSGHIDGTGRIQSLVPEGHAVWVTVAADESLIKYVVQKGSVAIDGISLTVVGVMQNGFRVSVIPHTGRETTLLTKKSGDIVNIECDMVGKYVEKFVGRAQGITEEFLQKYQF